VRNAALAALAVALAACGGGGSTANGGATTTAAPATTTTVTPTSPTAAGPPAAVQLRQVAKVSSPIALAVRSGESALYVAEQGGKLRRIVMEDNGKGKITYRLESAPVLDLSDNLTAGGEQGFLGVTFSPDGRRLYVAYTEANGKQRVDEFRMNDTTVDKKSRRMIFEIDDFAANHNGGDITFGPDGFLYYGMGDGGGGGDPMKTGQNPADLLGDLLRVDPEGGDPYGIPGGNPFKDGGGAPEVFAYGLRNPWRFSFDRETGDLWIGDVGQGQYEEIDFLPADQGGGNGANLGWSLREGLHDYEGGKEPKGATDPVYEYSHAGGGCAVVGGYVYRGQSIQGLAGTYLFTDNCDGEIRTLTMKDGEVAGVGDLGVQVSSPSSFGEGADGELYVLSLDGVIFRLDPA
jgi:glucose/arabinose dehydrogenase